MGKDRVEKSRKSDSSSRVRRLSEEFGALKGAQERVASLAEVPSLGLTLDAVTARGAALVISRTRDGGAVSVTVLDGDDRAKSYGASQDELDDIFLRMYGAYTGD